MEPLRLRRMPLLAAACCFAIGIALAHTWIPASQLAIAAAALALLVLAALAFARRIALLPLAALWIAAGIISWQWHPVPSAQHELQQFADGLSRDVRGRIVRVRLLPPQNAPMNTDSDPTGWQENEPQAAPTLSIDLAVDAVEEVTPDISRMVPVSGGVRITLLAGEAPPPAWTCGDVITLPLRLRTPQRYNDPGAWQYADYLLAQGLGTHATARPTKLKLVEHGAASLSCRLATAQDWASQRMRSFVASPSNQNLPRALRLSINDGAMLSAMLFGDRTHLTQQLRLGFERTGSFHLFVVSGMHVALLAAMLLFVFRILRIRELIAALVTVPAITAYALLTGFGAPVQRALFMTTVFLCARLLSRERSVLNALGAAALAELIWSPQALFEASFQMTFLSVFAIAGIAVPLGERTIIPWARASRNLRELWRDPYLPPHLAQFRVMLRLWQEMIADSLGRWLSKLPASLCSFALWTAELALISLVAEMVMALPMALYFHRATLFALPANMLTIPIIGLVAPLAVVLFLTSLLSPVIAAAPAAIVASLLHVISWSIARVSSIHSADLRIPGPSATTALTAFFLWAICLWAVRQSRRWAAFAVVMLPLGTIIALWPRHALTVPDKLEISAIDVGQGDSLFVAAPNGHTMLIDAGGPVGRGESSAATSAFDIGEEVVSPYLWSRRIGRLDVLVLTHAHSDHMGGMLSVMQNFRPREFWISVDHDLDTYRSLIRTAQDLGITVRHLHAGDAIPWGGVQLSILSPAVSYSSPGAPSNSDSLVMRMDYGKASALLEGDAEADSERSMLDRGLAPVTLLKIGHHGSRTSTTEEFFRALHPRVAVVSVGKNNSFGHPRGEVIERIARSGTLLYRTDEFGLTTFLLDRDGSIQEQVASLQP